MDISSRSLAMHELGGLYYVTFPSFDQTGMVRHLYSTRRGGVSEGCLASMNLGPHRGDKPENVFENYRRICAACGTFIGNMVFSQQVHGDRILYVDQQDRGKSLLKPVEMVGVDGLITDKPEVCLVTFHADCVPLYFLDTKQKIIGLAHAGWRGTVKGIGGKMIRTLAGDFGSDPKDILVGIGPSVGPCCFEVDLPVADEFARAFPERTHREIILPGKREEKRNVDLWMANAVDVVLAGVPAANVTMPDLCTCCHPEYFFSHRRTGNERGSQIAMMELI